MDKITKKDKTGIVWNIKILVTNKNNQFKQKYFIHKMTKRIEFLDISKEMSQLKITGDMNISPSQ